MITAVLGKKDFSKNFGKKGTSSDIAMFDFKSGDEESTFIEPILYPEKINSLITAVDMADSVVLYVSNDIMNFQLGEIILVLDYLKKEQGLLVFDNMVAEQIQNFIKGTVVEQYDLVENDIAKIKQKLQTFKFSKTAQGNTAIIDHSFQVKGVGDVFLGVVLSGIIRQYDKLKLYPANKEIIIKSLQVHDVDVKEIETGKRIGGSVKGCTLEDLRRGSIISDSEFLFGRQIEVNLRKNKFFAYDIPKNIMCYAGMQYTPCELEGEKVKFEKDVVYSKNQKIIFCDPSRKMRIAGLGEIK